MVTSVWRMVLLPVKVEWRSAMMESGDQSVTVDITGMTRMQLLCVCNWDFKEQVCHLSSYTTPYHRLYI